MGLSVIHMTKPKKVYKCHRMIKLFLCLFHVFWGFFASGKYWENTASANFPLLHVKWIIVLWSGYEDQSQEQGVGKLVFPTFFSLRCINRKSKVGSKYDMPGGIVCSISLTIYSKSKICFEKPETINNDYGRSRILRWEDTCLFVS